MPQTVILIEAAFQPGEGTEFHFLDEQLLALYDEIGVVKHTSAQG
jgi:hypothetical protein